MNIFSYVAGFAILVLIAGAGYFFTAKQSVAPSQIAVENNQNDSSDQSSTKTENETAAISGQTETETTQNDKMDVEPKIIEVNYSKNGYSPTNIEIKLGDTVKWSSDGAPMWTASAKHPTHEIYPEFDQKSDGGVYQFTFTKAGEWKYHNHLLANHFGSVVVK